MTFDDHAFCDSKDGIKDCGPLIGPLSGGMRLKELRMVFDYPKAVDLNASTDIECSTRGEGMMVVRLLPVTLDDVDQPGRFQRPERCAFR